MNTLTLGSNAVRSVVRVTDQYHKDLLLKYKTASFFGQNITDQIFNFFPCLNGSLNENEQKDNLMSIFYVMSQKCTKCQRDALITVTSQFLDLKTFLVFTNFM